MVSNIVSSMTQKSIRIDESTLQRLRDFMYKKEGTTYGMARVATEAIEEYIDKHDKK